MTGLVGIDLGTTHSLVAVRRGNETVVVPNAQGQFLTPSAVSFPPRREPLVGEPALAWALAGGGPVVTSVKRLMGTDQRIAVGNRQVTPVEVSAQILRKLARDASAALGWRVRDVVVTVPAYFNARQREDTAAAADLAGLRVARILNEPTAAALAYGLADERPQTMVVWDLGGGTFDVSILRLGHGVFQVAAVNGDSRLGGDDWDRALAEHMRFAVPAVADRPPVDWRLLRAARAARERLTDSSETVAEVPDGAPGNGRESRRITLFRRDLEALTAPLLARLLDPTRQALADAGLATADIDRVLLAGGATRMPAVQDLATRFFGLVPSPVETPDLLVAIGAALQAAILEGTQSCQTLVDVIPMTLGLEVAGGLVAPLIVRNTSLPARADRLFTVASEGQTSAHIHVIQGECPRAGDNTTLGRFDLEGLSGLPRGKACIEVAFEVDAGGILQVSAFDLHTQSWRKVEIVPFRHPAPTAPDSAA